MIRLSNEFDFHNQTQKLKIIYCEGEAALPAVFSQEMPDFYRILLVWSSCAKRPTAPPAADLLFLPPSEPQEISPIGNSADRALCVFCPRTVFQHAALEEQILLAPLLTYEKSREGYVPAPNALRAMLYMLAQKMRRAMTKQQDYTPLLLSAYFIELLHLIHNTPQEPTAKLHANIPTALVLEIADHIKENHAEITSLGDLSKQFGYSTKYLTQLFKKHLGCTAYEYLTEQKLSHAKELIRGGTNVTNACMNAGFSDYSHFIQLFKKRYGTTPLKYRKQFK